MTVGAITEALQQSAFSHVVNLASYGVDPSQRDPILALEANTVLPASIATACANVGCSMVHIGSVSEYDPDDSALLKERTTLQTKALYGATKAAGMISAHAIARQGLASFAGLRLFNIYGPNEAPHRLFPFIMSKLSTGKRAALSDGLQERDFVHVNDACDAIVHVCGRMSENSQTICNVATGVATSVRRFSEIIAEAANADRELLGFGEIERRPDDLPRVVGDPSAMRSTFGWSAKIDVLQGLTQMVEVRQV
jgi:nucleoside-diphosphate-sugar epimerase